MTLKFKIAGFSEFFCTSLHWTSYTALHILTRFLESTGFVTNATSLTINLHLGGEWVVFCWDFPSFRSNSSTNYSASGSHLHPICTQHAFTCPVAKTTHGTGSINQRNLKAPKNSTL